MAKKDYYRILNIDHKASLKAIKSAYRQLALKYHPDHNPNNQMAAKQYILIREAYERLTDSDFKRRYDATYKPQPRPSAKPDAPTRSGTSEADKSAGSSKNLRYNLYITLEDVATGCERGIRYIRKNKNESETVQLKVKVPKGAFHHQRLKLGGYGDLSKEGVGDLFVIIHLQNHPIFLKNGLDLRVNVPVTYIDAALGAMIEVPTLTGIRKIKLKACEFEDLSHTLKGFGLPDMKPHIRGDLHIHCFIEHPQKLSPTEKNAMQKLQSAWPQGEMMRQYQTYLTQLKRS